VKSAREQLDILSAYAELGSFRAAAALCGTTPKTVRRVVERRSRPKPERLSRPKSTDPFGALIAERVRATNGRISAKRLLLTAQAAGYDGSLRHFRRAVAEAKAAWRDQRRVYRPWVPIPGEHLVSGAVIEDLLLRWLYQPEAVDLVEAYRAFAEAMKSWLRSNPATTNVSSEPATPHPKDRPVDGCEAVPGPIEPEQAAPGAPQDLSAPSGPPGRPPGFRRRK
jgi:hypothetical protein